MWYASNADGQLQNNNQIRNYEVQVQHLNVNKEDLQKQEVFAKLDVRN